MDIYGNFKDVCNFYSLLIHTRKMNKSMPINIKKTIFSYLFYITINIGTLTVTISNFTYRKNIENPSIVTWFKFNLENINVFCTGDRMYYKRRQISLPEIKYPLNILHNGVH